MLLTEEQAHEKWCPHIRMVTGTLTDDGRSQHPHQPSYNRVVAENGYAWPRAASCIASQCMAWRWGVFRHQRNLPERDRTPCGYCGLSGKPGETA